MKKRYLCTLLIVALVGCQDTEKPEDKEVSNVIQEEMIADIAIKGTRAPGKEVILEATVKEGNNLVTEALEVQFEVRRSGEDKRELFMAKNTGSGTYQVMHTFMKEGEYYVTAHVTSNGQHVMPQKKVIISDHQVEGTAMHPRADVWIEFHSNPVDARGSSTLEADVQMDGKPLTDADVHFEVWKEGSDESRFTNAKEEGKGTYFNTFTFQEAGTYKVQVHVEKDEIHEHQLQTVRVD